MPMIDKSIIFPESLMLSCSKCGARMFGGVIVQLTKHWMKYPECEPVEKEASTTSQAEK